MRSLTPGPPETLSEASHKLLVACVVGAGVALEGEIIALVLRRKGRTMLAAAPREEAAAAAFAERVKFDDGEA